MISSGGAFLLGICSLPFLYKVWKSYKAGSIVTVDDPRCRAERKAAAADLCALRAVSAPRPGTGGSR
jgi:hypothetical protein